MCEIDWKILHKFVDSLVWPSLLLIIFLRFKRQITKLINRISDDSQEIEIGGFFKAQLREVEKIKEATLQGGALTTEQTKNLISATVLLQIETIKKLGEEYIVSKYDKRRIIESQINEYSVGLTIEDLSSLFNSTETSHKIATAIALDYVLYRTNEDPSSYEKVKEFIVNSLNDENSFLRYEILQLVFSSNKLKVELNDRLGKMYLNEKNPAIKNILKLYLK